MRARRSRSLAVLVMSGALAVLLAACPTPKSPVGPPPEYEEPAAPSWFGEAGAGGSVLEAGTVLDAGSVLEAGSAVGPDGGVEAGSAAPPVALPPPG